MSISSDSEQFDIIAIRSTQLGLQNSLNVDSEEKITNECITHVGEFQKKVDKLQPPHVVLQKSTIFNRFSDKTFDEREKLIHCLAGSLAPTEKEEKERDEAARYLLPSDYWHVPLTALDVKVKKNIKKEDPKREIFAKSLNISEIKSKIKSKNDRVLIKRGL